MSRPWSQAQGEKAPRPGAFDRRQEILPHTSVSTPLTGTIRGKHNGDIPSLESFREHAKGSPALPYNGSPPP